MIDWKSYVTKRVLTWNHASWYHIDMKIVFKNWFYYRIWRSCKCGLFNASNHTKGWFIIFFLLTSLCWCYIYIFILGWAGISWSDFCSPEFWQAIVLCTWYLLVYTFIYILNFTHHKTENLGNHDPDTSFFPSSDYNLGDNIKRTDEKATAKNFHNESVQLGKFIYWHIIVSWRSN